MIEVKDVKLAKETLVQNVINALTQLKEEYPEQEIYIEVPGNVAQCKLGDALIFEGKMSTGPIIAIDAE